MFEMVQFSLKNKKKDIKLPNKRDKKAYANFSYFILTKIKQLNLYLQATIYR